MLSIVFVALVIASFWLAIEKTRENRPAAIIPDDMIFDSRYFLSFDDVFPVEV